VEKAIKEIREKKATGDDDVLAGVLEMLGEDSLRLVTNLMRQLHETGQRHSGFTEVIMLVLKNETKATKCSDNCKIKFQNILGKFILIRKKELVMKLRR